MSKQISVVDNLKKGILQMEGQFRAALPAHIKTEKFIRVVQTAMSNTYGIEKATPRSVYSSCMKLAQMGLMPDGEEAAIVCYGDKAQQMPMVKGILKLVRNSGELASLSPHVVYVNDDFDYWIDEQGEHIKHRPELTEDPGEVLLAYAMARTKDGGVYIEVMNKKEIDQVRSSSKSGGKGPWANWYGEMAKKTVIRRLAKRLPMSTDLDDAHRAEDDMYNMSPKDESPIEAAPPKEVKDVKPKTKPNKLKEMIVEKEPEPAPPVIDVDEEIPI